MQQPAHAAALGANQGHMSCIPMRDNRPEGKVHDWHVTICMCMLNSTANYPSFSYSLPLNNCTQQENAH